MTKLPDNWQSMPDYDLGALVLCLYIAESAQNDGLELADIPDDYAEAITITMASLPDDYDTQPENDSLVLIMRLAATGKFEAAGRKFRAFMLHGAHVKTAFDEAVTGRRKQQKNARKPRPDALQELIIGILKDDPNISDSQLLAKLEEQKKMGVIEDIDDDEIAFYDQGKLQAAKISGLKDRKSRAKRIEKKSR